jgi:hypothetical protein
LKNCYPQTPQKPFPKSAPKTKVNKWRSIHHKALSRQIWFRQKTGCDLGENLHEWYRITLKVLPTIQKSYHQLIKTNQTDAAATKEGTKAIKAPAIIGNPNTWLSLCHQMHNPQKYCCVKNPGRNLAHFIGWKISWLYELLPVVVLEFFVDGSNGDGYVWICRLVWCMDQWLMGVWELLAVDRLMGDPLTKLHEASKEIIRLHGTEKELICHDL